MTKAVHKAKALIGGILRGMNSPGDTFSVNRYAYPHESAQAAMRSDWVRVGNELHNAIERADGEAAAQSPR